MTMQRREQEAESRRLLWRGIGASLLLHALVLGGGAGLLRLPVADGPLPSEPLVARLTSSSPLPTQASAPAVRSAAPKNRPGETAALSSTPRPEPRPADAAVAVTNAVSAPERLPSPSADTTPGTAAVGSTTRAEGEGRAVAGAATTAAISESGGLDANALRGYRLSLALQARRVKRYPPQAMAAGWEGTAEVRIAVGPGGRALGAELARSSGHELLDRAAVGMIESAVQRAAVPAALQPHAFAVVLPVVFSLEER